MTRRLARWRGAVTASAVLALAGVFDGNGTLVLAAAIPLLYVGYGSLTTVSVPAGVTAERTVEPTPAPPGQTVKVTLNVTNESEQPLSDVRIVDGVPADLAVVEGTPRAGTTLDVGESCTIEYGLVARRGEYAFDRPRVRLRSAGASAIATTDLSVAGDEGLDCRLDADAPPLYERGADYVGQMSADRPGRGVEFHSSREYRPGDPADRINWRQYAKRGTLATVNYDRWVSSTVVIVLDARQFNRVAAGPGRPTAVELEAYVATRALSALFRAGHDVAVAVLGVRGDGPERLVWLPPASGANQRSRALETFRQVTDGRLPSASVDPEQQVRKLVALVPPSSQLLYLSPFLDEHPTTAVETWRASDLPVVAVSPDVVSTNTVSGQFTQTNRRAWLAASHRAGARTIDWQRGTPLALVLEYAFAAEAKLSETAPPAGGGR